MVCIRKRVENGLAVRDLCLLNPRHNASKERCKGEAASGEERVKGMNV